MKHRNSFDKVNGQANPVTVPSQVIQSPNSAFTATTTSTTNVAPRASNYESEKHLEKTRGENYSQQDRDSGFKPIEAQKVTPVKTNTEITAKYNVAEVSSRLGGSRDNLHLIGQDSVDQEDKPAALEIVHVRQKSSEELECDLEAAKLASELKDKDLKLSGMLAPAKQTKDYMGGLFTTKVTRKSSPNKPNTPPKTLDDSDKRDSIASSNSDKK